MLNLIKSRYLQAVHAMPSSPAGSHDGDDSSSARFILSMMLVLFFMWGFITCLNDLLIPRLKVAFTLDYTQVMLVQFSFFLAYAVMSVPCSRIIARIGYRLGAIIGLITAALGCLLFMPSVWYLKFSLFLVGLFVLASGIVMLQVAANPCVTLLGSVQRASSRLTFAQALNSLGTTLAPLIMGGVIIAGGIVHSYLLLAALLVLCSGLVWVVRNPLFKQLGRSNVASASVRSAASAQSKSIWRQRRLMLGALGIFVYVGAEVSAGSLLTNYLHLPHIAGISLTAASRYLAFYWGGALIGRFIGSVVLRFIPASKAVVFNVLAACILIIVSVTHHGRIAMWSMIALGLFNSIMFPSIFALALQGLGERTSQASGLLCTAIAGGAVIPELQGMLADHIGLQPSFLLLIVCYLYIGYFCGFVCRRG